MIFLNFKIYQETSGENTLKLCRLIRRLTDKRVIPCLQAADIFRVKQILPDLEVWAQHADPVGYGKFTGYQAPVSLKMSGAGGVLLNHSEHGLDFKTLKKTVAAAKKAELKIMIIADTAALIKKANKLKPDYIGFEDPQLIGGPIAMIDAHFGLIKQAASAAQGPLIVGGGIRTTNHVRKSLLAGGKGVLVASEFAQSPNSKQTLQELILGLDR
ncbi:MAG: Triosephosphate isomerase [Candidatus Beckwithbacteria bacterium GW2011_GWA2_43_10]|uniref:Triosephosphate isomerase n=1 Tax=Candidatus Beckwithbacteria bacterium GW2011_GWA2_43_10 TaxID=1618369 RepID=A0A0G1C373_9BACT|nr:MAG: Triosephosphate isomerase [Candidatus Beckwithbacteria bacterium GW2011_GWA2_43_10]